MRVVASRQVGVDIRSFALADAGGYPQNDIGVYIQPQNMGTCCHCEFSLPYYAENKMEVARMNLRNLVFRQLEMAAAGKSMMLAEASACKLYAAQAAMDSIPMLWNASRRFDCSCFNACIVPVNSVTVPSTAIRQPQRPSG